jgi:archaellum component FlaC
MNQRDILVREYLRQQVGTIVQQEAINQEEFTNYLTNDEQINVHHNQLVPVNTSSEDDLNKFKEQVRSWLKLDNEIKTINSKIKILDNERKHRKKFIDLLSQDILRFMSSNEIDELNSKHGVIKYKRSMRTEPLTQKKIISSLMEEFQNSSHAIDKINKIFKDRSKVEVLRLTLK